MYQEHTPGHLSPTSSLLIFILELFSKKTCMEGERKKDQFRRGDASESFIRGIGRQIISRWHLGRERRCWPPTYNCQDLMLTELVMGHSGTLLDRAASHRIAIE